MADLPLHNLQTHWAAIFIQECYDAGLRHAVISPGSRSTPLTIACATHPGITTHVVVDERSAGFFAVGLSRGEGVPAALVCTSGTAVANYFPAVVEARMSETPLLVLTADRPPMHRDVGASQAIDQHHIFGRYPRFFLILVSPIQMNLISNTWHFWHDRHGYRRQANRVVRFTLIFRSENHWNPMVLLSGPCQTGTAPKAEIRHRYPFKNPMWFPGRW